MSAGDDEFERVLGVSRSADAATIKRAYRVRAMQLHPDRNPDDAAARARFEELNRVYAEWTGVPSSAEPRATSTDAAVPTEFSFEQLENLFGEFFGGAGAKPRSSKRGADLQVPLVLSLGEARVGTKRDVAITRRVRCLECGGSGARDPESVRVCSDCGGQGTQSRQNGAFRVALPCAACAGTGKRIGKRCAYCDRGLMARPASVTVTVPPGMSSGMKLRLQGQGEEGLGGEPGDLFLAIEIGEAQGIDRRANDALVEAVVDTRRGLFGGSIDVATPNGTKQVRVPWMVRDRSELRLSGEGSAPREAGDPYRGTGDPGDVLVVFRVPPAVRGTRIAVSLATVGLLVTVLSLLASR